MSDPALSDSVLRQKIRELFLTLLLRDRARTAAQVKALGSFDRARLEGLYHYLENLSAHNLVRFAGRLDCKTDPALPISAKADEIAAALRDHQVVIICGATGSGKTTQLPKIALSVGFGRYGRIAR